MGGSNTPHRSGPNRSSNNDARNKHTEVRDVISDEYACKINGPSLGVNDSQNGAVMPLAPQVSLQLQQQHIPPGPVVRWDRILPVRTLKVLLVESDDSTRHVVSALLRNCSYEVSAAADGLQAWKVLENPTNHVDLVLTEVTVPSLNGIGLLSKIMSNDACKNIPVIMMSSNDNTGTVFKCLSKGAVDFLVKPIRKNELKNLWQHVWRRSHSSSGSVSESGIHIQKSGKSRSVNECDDISSSDDDDDVASMGLNVRDGSDNGSGTQSSWTKHAVEINSPQPTSPLDQIADPHDSTCAQVISDTEAFPNKRVNTTDNKHDKKQVKHADELMGKDLEIGVPRTSELHPKSHHSLMKFTKQVDMGVDYHSEIEMNNKNEDAFVELSTKAAYLIGGIANNTETQLIDNTDEPSNKVKETEGSKEPPSLRLSLKRTRSPGEGANSTHEDRNILRRSAFSRYRNSAASTQAQTACVGSCSPVDNSSDVLKTESRQNMVSNSNPITLKQGSNESSDNNDNGSTTNPATCKEKMPSKVIMKGTHPSAFHPVQIPTSTQPITQENISEPEASKFQYQVQHHHHHYHHHHHHVHNTQNSSENDELAVKNMNAITYVGPVEGNGSNSGSNGQNISGTIAENAIGVSEKCAGNGSGSGSASGVDQNRIAQREAALIKFKQKRKERNFEKKVRYYSRKKLAEQRPRVRGQFVRQPSGPESKIRGHS